MVRGRKRLHPITDAPVGRSRENGNEGPTPRSHMQSQKEN